MGTETTFGTNRNGTITYREGSTGYWSTRVMQVGADRFEWSLWRGHPMQRTQWARGECRTRSGASKAARAALIANDTMAGVSRA